jgi:16S rRNA (guanine527-N7)-methyltransferase
VASKPPAYTATLLTLFEEARDHGFLGPGPLETHLAHAAAFADLVPDPPARAVDLGSGAGVPGLILAGEWPDSRCILLEAQERRAAFLREAVSHLELAHRVEVVGERAEAAGRDPRHRGQADLVVVRSFGPPATVAECAAPFLRRDGLLVVAEPPGGTPERWPPEGLATVGLVLDAAVVEPWALLRLRQAQMCPDRYPRRVGIPRKRPLFRAPTG